MRRKRLLRDFALGGVGLMSAARALEQAEIRENEDGTFDLIGVEILSVGGPIFGIGSPPDGDFWTLDELRGMETADRELGDELLPINKIGHPDEQVMVANSIKAGEIPEAGEMPAVGWLEDLRLNGEKLLADVKHVPKVVVELIQKGAYRTRSVELSKVTSQTTGKTYDWVVTGLAWLGGKMPAVKTLGDVFALYEGDVPIRRVFVDNRDYAAGDVVWPPERSLQGLRYELQEALGSPGPELDTRWYVLDVSLDQTAIVEDWSAVSPGDLDCWLVSFTVNPDGSVTPQPFNEWTKVERTWIEAARQNEERALTLSSSRPDTRAMKFTAEQRRAFAEATGIEESKITDKMLEDAGVQPPADPPDPPAADPAADEPETPATGANTGGEEPTEPAAAADAAERENAEAIKRLEAKLTARDTEIHQEARRSFVVQAIKDFKIHPGQRKDLEKLFDRDADAARAFVDGLVPREDLRVAGVNPDDDVDGEGRDLKEEQRSYEGSFQSRFGRMPEGAKVV